MKGTSLLARMLEDAHEWLEDVFGDEVPEDLGPVETVQAIERHYEGGWQAFIRDGEYPHEQDGKG